MLDQIWRSTRTSRDGLMEDRIRWNLTFLELRLNTMRFVFASLFCLSAFASEPAGILNSIPLRFEPDCGQHKQTGPSQVLWSAHGIGYAFAFTDQAAILRWRDRAVSLTFPGASPAHFEGVDRANAAANYFVGKRYVSAPGFDRLRRTGVYPGIDVVYYGRGRQMEYDFEIAPGADPSQIRIRFDGADALHLNESGGIVLTAGDGEVIQHAPVVYQRTRHGRIVAVQAAYEIDPQGVVRLRLGKYNRGEALVVDPVITYSEYLNGTTGADAAIAIAHDAQGLVYLAGYTYSTDFPTIGDAFSTIEDGDRDVWVAQLDLTNPNGAVLYSSFIGGSSTDNLTGMTVDSNGVMYLVGTTTSVDFPTTAGAYSITQIGTTNAFVIELDPSQPSSSSLVYSTYLGGTGNDDEGQGIAVAGGKIYVTGFTNSTDFPVVGAYQSTYGGGYDAFVAEIDPAQSGAASVIASTFLGGSNLDAGRTIAVDSAGNVYVAGVTFSPSFPMSGTGYQSNYDADGDGFLAELNLNAGTLVYSTFLGGSSEEEVKKIAIESSGQVALTGYTLSADFPITQNAYQTVMGTNGNAFVAVLNLATAGQGLIYSTYYGGSGGEVAYDLRQDAFGRFYIGGYTLSHDLPVTSDALSPASAGGGVDAFLAVIDPTQAMNGLVYGTYLTGPGTQTVYGLDLINPGSTTAPGTIQLGVVGITSSNILPAANAQIQYPGHTTAFFFVLQFQEPASERTSAIRPGARYGVIDVNRGNRAE